MEWVEAVPERLQDAVWYGVLIGIAAAAYVFGYRKMQPFLKVPVVTDASIGSLTRLEESQRDAIGKIDDITGGLRQVCASIEAASRRQIEEFERLCRLIEELIRLQRRD